MSCGTTNVKFRLKRGTTEQWLASTLPLALGEPGYDTVTNDLKIGNGTSLWKDLPVVDHTLIKNVGLNAYIQSATFTGTYDASNQRVNYSIVLFGNSSRYDIVFTYEDPNIPATLTPINASPAKIVTNSGTIYNHSAGRSDSYLHTGVAPTVGGTYLVTMTVSTANAGGTGTGSTFSVTNSVSISSDTMGNPSISSSSGIVLSNGSVVRISGIDYYTSGTTLTIPSSALRLNNIYNIVNPSNFIYLSDTSPAISESTQYLVRESDNTAYPGSSGVNTTWKNNRQIAGGMTVSSFSSPIYSTSRTLPVNAFTVTNALNKTNTYYYDSTNNTLTAGTPSKNIAYVSPWNNAGSTSYQNEITIPKNQGGTTNLAISSQTRTTYTVSGDPTLNAFNISQLTTFTPSSLNTNDPLYFPFDGNFYASAPPFSNYVFPVSPSFTTGTKYLCIAFTNSAPLVNFTLKLSGSTSIGNIYVAWRLSSTSYGWFDGSVPYNSGSNTGCQYASPTSGNTIWYFNINSTLSSAYSTAASGGTIYVLVKFSGVVPIHQILFT